MPYHVYLLRCEGGELYVGITTDLDRRFAEHAAGGPKGARYTRTHKPMRFEATWEMPDRASASALEYRLKRCSHDRKQAIAETPTLADPLIAESLARATSIGTPRTRLRLHVLASGSKGNCSVVEDIETGALAIIDCGISKKAFLERSATCGIDPARVEAILVTHEHTDHVKGLGVLTRGLAKLGAHPALYVSDAVHRASPEICTIENDVDLRHFTAGDSIAIGGMTALAFPTLHDAAESFGFRLDADGDALGFMTDTGIVTEDAAEALSGCRMLAIEANHDLEMLEQGPYPRYLKARIASERGHLSNGQSAELLDALLCNELEQVVGMHVSQNNNTYKLPSLALKQALEARDHPAAVHVGYQDRPISL